MVTVEGMGHTWPENHPRGTKLLLDFFGDKVKGS
jgi:poly(3-hydroxybutyrate) depolymerase